MLEFLLCFCGDSQSKPDMLVVFAVRRPLEQLLDLVVGRLARAPLFGQSGKTGRTVGRSVLCVSCPSLQVGWLKSLKLPKRQAGGRTQNALGGCQLGLGEGLDAARNFGAGQLAPNEPIFRGWPGAQTYEPREMWLRNRSVAQGVDTIY